MSYDQNEVYEVVGKQFTPAYGVKEIGDGLIEFFDMCKRVTRPQKTKLRLLTLERWNKNRKKINPDAPAFKTREDMVKAIRETAWLAC